VGTHSAKANAMVRSLLEQRLLSPHLPAYDRVQPEVKYGAGNKSRVDFVLHSGDGSGSGDDTKDSSSIAPSKRRRTARGSNNAAAAADVAAAVAADAAAPAEAAATPVPTASNGGEAGQQSCCYVEVKSVTLAENQAQVGMGQ